ncbi:MAG: TIGR00269 family protein [Nitrososphaerota archaeon]|nr:TIGR00269 family protein [Nitrososphaerales archaeon]MDW8044424.1 TIGR00269 family protein [Nitrososphaerota archaeon]
MKCTKCGIGRPIYKRLYSGEQLCPSCFTSSILKKVRRTISRFKMLKHGDRVAVAVSGGKDSLTLLTILDKLCRKHASQLYAISVDEGIEGYRDEALEYADRVCSDLNIPHATISYQELYGFTLDEALKCRKDLKISACALCGVLRRRALDIIAERVKADVVATAHNLDDYIQTFIINILSGDLERLGWLDPTYEPHTNFAIRRVKPLIELYEQEIALYAYLKKIPFQEVSCPYREEGIRSEIRNFLNDLESRHAGIKYIIFKSALSIAHQSRILHRKDSIKRCIKCGYPSSSQICSVCQILESIRKNM